MTTPRVRLVAFPSFLAVLAFCAVVVQAATFVVDTTLDGPVAAGECSTSTAPCSLRGAIEAANHAPDGDRIHFALQPSDPGFSSGYWTIEPTSLLPAFRYPLLVDGTTQRGAECAGAPGAPHRLLVRLDGRRVPDTGAFSRSGLRAGEGDGSTIRGLSITGFPHGAINISASTEVLCNYLGLKPDGSPGGNRDGLIAHGGGHRIGGRSDAERNVISANSQTNVVLRGDDILVEGNYIGTDPTGTSALAPQGPGIFMLNGSRALIGGEHPGAGNLISGNERGIEVGRSFVSGERFVYSDAVIQGNLIGTDRSGLLDLGNNQEGVLVSSPDTLVGGDTLGQGNVISANGRSGVAVSVKTKRPRVLGNRIGVSVDGSALGNGRDGIRNEGPIGTFGGPGAASNVVAHNDGAGVSILVTSSVAEASAQILENSIHSNGDLGIDITVGIALDGVTANDPQDATNSRALNWPIVTAATTGGTNTTIEGTLNSRPRTPFDLRFFASANADPSGHGEGELYLGLHTVTTDGGGDASFTAVLPVAAPDGWFVSGTTTAVSGERYTSEFGPAIGSTASASPIGRMALTLATLAGLVLLFVRLLRRRRT